MPKKILNPLLVGVFSRHCQIWDIKVNNRITSSTIQKMFNVRRKAANSYLKKLIDLGLIARKGAGKMIHYVFKIG